MDKYTHKNQKEQSTQKSVNPQKDTLSYLKQ